MRHPLEKLTPRAFRIFVLLFFAGTLITGLVLAYLAEGFTHREGPEGESFDIIAFELAATPSQAARILETWGEEGIGAAQFQTRLDFLFLVFYSTLAAMALLGTLPLLTGAPRIALLIRILAGAQWVAGLSDAVENAALLHILAGHPVSPWPQLAFCCASLKFFLLIAGALIALPLLILRCWKAFYA